MSQYWANIDPFSVALWTLVVVLGVFFVYLTILAIRLLHTLGVLRERVDAALRELELTGAKIREAAEHFLAQAPARAANPGAEQGKPGAAQGSPAPDDARQAADDPEAAPPEEG